MKQFITGILILLLVAFLLLLAACNRQPERIVSEAFVDSLISDFATPEIIKANAADLLFWKNRIDPKNPGLTSELRYAACLVQRFHLAGDIQDLMLADSLLQAVDRHFNHKETSPKMALLRNAILQHRFKEADSLLSEAKKIGLKAYEEASTSFDVAFEFGYYPLAENQLKKIADPKDYGYNFRNAKQAHYKGELDSSIAAMQRAADIAGNNMFLQQAALSNEADLYLHSGDLAASNERYARSIRISNADLHSLMGLGWIALVHDQNDSLAEKIFRFVQTKTKSPDPLWKLIAVAAQRGDTVAERKYARDFETVAIQPAFGNMYNKYLLELYTGILNEPAKAEALAQKELSNRTTPQTYAWYVWSLYKNGKIADADNCYHRFVSGKPLEGLELYWMGKFMQGMGKGYNAKQFYNAAYKNRYDLSPSMVKDLEAMLEI